METGALGAMPPLLMPIPTESDDRMVNGRPWWWNHTAWNQKVRGFRGAKRGCVFF